MSGYLSSPFSPPRPLSRPSSRNSVRSNGRPASPSVSLPDDTGALILEHSRVDADRAVHISYHPDTDVHAPTLHPAPAGTASVAGEHAIARPAAITPRHHGLTTTFTHGARPGIGPARHVQSKTAEAQQLRSAPRARWARFKSTAAKTRREEIVVWRGKWDTGGYPNHVWYTII